MAEVDIKSRDHVADHINFFPFSFFGLSSSFFIFKPITIYIYTFAGLVAQPLACRDNTAASS